jgi:hypothetical protein
VRRLHAELMPGVCHGGSRTTRARAAGASLRFIRVSEPTRHGRLNPWTSSKEADPWPSS